MIVFFVAEPLVDSKTGCRAANLLRYYLVMVTLMWSGVEGVNMYLKLVRVFNSDITYFVRKAAITAWGETKRHRFDDVHTVASIRSTPLSLRDCPFLHLMLPQVYRR